MPVRWQVTHYFVSYGSINLSDYPSYDQYLSPRSGCHRRYDQLISGTLWVIQDSDQNTPQQQLFTDIYATGVTPIELLTNQTGWLKQVDVSH